MFPHFDMTDTSEAVNVNLDVKPCGRLAKPADALQERKAVRDRLFTAGFRDALAQAEKEAAETRAKYGRNVSAVLQDSTNCF